MRYWLLTVGPVLLSRSATRRRVAPAFRRGGVCRKRGTDRGGSVVRCRPLRNRTARGLRGRGPRLDESRRAGGLAVLVRPPFVMVSNTSVAELEQLHTGRAGSVGGGARTGVLRCSGHRAVKGVAQGRGELPERGAQSRRVRPAQLRRLLPEVRQTVGRALGTGLGTLSHELCHAYTPTGLSDAARVGRRRPGRTARGKPASATTGC